MLTNECTTILYTYKTPRLLKYGNVVGGIHKIQRYRQIDRLCGITEYSSNTNTCTCWDREPLWKEWWSATWLAMPSQQTFLLANCASHGLCVPTVTEQLTGSRGAISGRPWWIIEVWHWRARRGFRGRGGSTFLISSQWPALACPWR